MRIVKFNAHCPFEVGDKITSENDGTIHTITDIACIHYSKNEEVEFLYELDDDEQYVVLEGFDDAK